jgi:hypothetical protein
MVVFTTVGADSGDERGAESDKPSQTYHGARVGLGRTKRVFTNACSPGAQL